MQGEATTICVTTHAMIVSIANCCSLVCMNCSHPNLVNTQINNNNENIPMRTICYAVEPTKTEWLKVAKSWKISQNQSV